MKAKYLMGGVAAAAAVLALAASTQAQAPAPAAAQAARPARDPNAWPTIPGQNLKGMHVYIRAGLKTHPPTFHDYPQFLGDWSKVLTEHGAVVDGSFHFPTPDEIKNVDVIVMYKGDTGYMTDVEKKTLEAFVKRGGGIVGIHDFMCGPDPDWYANYVGGAKKHTETNFQQFKMTYTVLDKASPIMKTFPADETLQEEAFFKMTWAKTGLHPLATVTFPNDDQAKRIGAAGQTVPQIWEYTHTLPGGQEARAFVWAQGHLYADINRPEIRDMLLRGIAWAGHHPVDELVDYKPPAPAPRANNAADRAVQGQE